jgi:glycopeptide antibiotics resistance protein
MAERTHFAAPLLLAVIVALILYVSLFPFEFAAARTDWSTALRSMTWARASRSDMFNNVLLYAPLGFCLALLLEPRLGRLTGLLGAAVGGAALSLTMELTQASIAPRVPSLTDLSLNAAGTALGAAAGSAWHAFGSRIAPQGNPRSRSRTVAITIVALWLLQRLWPLVPEPGLSQVKRAVRPLLEPQFSLAEIAAYFVAWLIVAQALVHLARRQRTVDALLMVVATVLVGRAIVEGSELVVAEMIAIALIVPALVPLSRVEDRTRCLWLTALLVAWLSWVALQPLTVARQSFDMTLGSLELALSRAPPAPPQIFGKAFSYLSLGWLLVGTGLLPHVAAGLTVLAVLALCILQLGTGSLAYGWVDLLIAIPVGIMIARWMPSASAPRSRPR